MSKNMARPVAWLPDDRYIYESPSLTARERVKIVVGSIALTVVFFGLMLALSLVAR